MSSDKTDGAKVHVEGVGGDTTLSKAQNSQQLADRRVRQLRTGVKPPYNPDRLASFLELNETHATAIRKKSRYEVGFGFDIVPVPDVDPDEAGEQEQAVAREFWRGRDSHWQTGPHQSAEPTTPEEVKELARQNYHSLGWCCLEILTDMEGRPTGLAHVPANTVRVRKPQSRYDQPRHPEEGTYVDGDAAQFASRGYVQIRDGQRRYFGEAGDRYHGLEPTISGGEDDPRVTYTAGPDSGKEPIYVDRETGEVATGDTDALPNGPANELIFVRNPSPLEQQYGVPDWVSAIRTIGSDEAAKDYNREFFDNDTIPRFVIKVTGGELTGESKEDLRQMLHGLREESHRAVILEVEKFQAQLDDDDVEIELEPLGQGISEEMDFRLFREKNEHEIAKVHEVPPILIGVTETSNRSNSQEQVADFANNVIAPEQHKFARRLYEIIHQQALGISDWTIDYELRGADQPKENADIARRKIQAVSGAIPVNRALEMVGEDPLPDDHPIDGETLVANVGQDTPPGGQPEGGSRSEDAPPEDNKIDERDWADIKADLVGKDQIETTTFDSGNLDEALYDFGEQQLFMSFHRPSGPSSLYVYVNVPATKWAGLTSAADPASYHYDNIRLAFAYVEITNFHSRLPEGPEPDPDEIPDDIPSELSASWGDGVRDFSERRKTPDGVPEDAYHIDDESECDGTAHEGPRGGLYCSPPSDEDIPGEGAIQDEAPDEWDGSEGARNQLQDAVESAVGEGATVGDALAAARDSIDGLDASGERVVAETAYVHQSETIEVGSENVDAGPVVRDAFSADGSDVRQAAEAALNDDYVEEPAYGPERHGSQPAFDAWRVEEDGSLLNDNTAELWGAAIDTTGNDNIPDDATTPPNTVGDPLPGAEGGDPVTAIGDSVSVTREVLRETFGETVPVARGVSGEFAEEIQEAAESGEDVEINHRALESWSTFPAHAEQFAEEGDEDGVIIRTEIPVDEVWGSSHTTPGLAEEENELIVGKDGPESYSPENIYIPEDEDMTELYTETTETGA